MPRYTTCVPFLLNNQMSALYQKAARAALQSLFSRPAQNVRECSFWFGMHTMVPTIDVPPLYHDRLTPRKTVANYVPGHTFVDKHDDYEYNHLKPHYPDLKWPALEQVTYEDKGLLGDPDFRNLKDIATDIVDCNPKIGTEVRGVDLADLTDDQKNDIARLVAVRGVVFFRKQRNFGVEAQRQLGAYFGTLHKHATTASPRCGGLDDVQVVWTDENFKFQRAYSSPTFMWHSDATYEIQPPSYTSFKLLTTPPQGAGGDSLWSSQYAAYNVLSAPMQAYLCSLTALHSSKMEYDSSIAASRVARRDHITTAHPLVRTHLVTGWKSLFFNPGFITKIVGIPKMESDAIIRYLNELIVTTQEMHVRFQWQKDDVAFWDSRIVNHVTAFDFVPHRRHALQVSCHAERPYLDPASKSQREDYAELRGCPLPYKDGASRSSYND